MLLDWSLSTFLIFSYMLARLIALQKTTADSQKSPKHKFRLESEQATAEDGSYRSVTAVGKALSCEQNSVGLCVQTASYTCMSSSLWQHVLDGWDGSEPDVLSHLVMV